jgi:hypothetical protein
MGFEPGKKLILLLGRELIENAGIGIWAHKISDLTFQISCVRHAGAGDEEFPLKGRPVGCGCRKRCDAPGSQAN